MLNGINRFLPALAILACLPAISHADDLQAQIAICNKFDSDPDLKIGACTFSLQSGQLDSSNQAIALAKRGDAFKVKGDYNSAVRDYSSSLQLRPTDYAVMCLRGNVYLLMKNLQQARMDFQAALDGNPADDCGKQGLDMADMDEQMPNAGPVTQEEYDQFMADPGNNSDTQPQ